jgi:glucans biosynthesis protein C
MSAPPAPAPAATRRHDLDWLRITAVFLLVPYHSSRIFDTWEAFYVKNAATSAGLTAIRALLDPWGMPLLFVIAGAATWLALRRRSAARYLRERVLRLIVPLLVGIVVLVPPQAYLAWLGQGNHGSFGAFLGPYWAMRTGEPMGFTGGFTVGHLWFVIYLFVFSVVALPVFLLLRRPPGARAIRRLANVAAWPGGIFLLVIPFRLTEPLPGPTVGGLNPFAYLFLFVTGFVLLAEPRFQEALDRSWRWALGLGVVALVALTATRVLRVEFAEGSWQSTARDSLQYFTTWTWVIGALGFGHRRLNRSRRWLPYLNAAAYPFYLLHQTVILLIGFVVIRWPIGTGPKFLVIALLATGATLGLYEGARRWGVMRALLGAKHVASGAT